MHPAVPVLALAAAWWIVIRRPSPNFSWKEMGSPPLQYRPNGRLMALHVLEPIRERIGPFSPTSAWRSKVENDRVDGNPASKHMKLLAVDVGAVNGLSVAQVYAAIKDIPWAIPVEVVYGAPDHLDHVHIEYQE